MAIRRRKRKKTTIKDVGSPLAEQRDELQKWLIHVRDNLVLYLASILFLAACGFAGVWYSVSRAESEQAFMTKYAAALSKEKPEEQLAALEPLSGEKNRWTPELLYTMGETAIRTSAYDKAETAFKQVVEEFGASEFAPQAAEGLAFLAENKGDQDAALAGYKQISEKWANSFTARRQPFNIARVMEAKGDFKGAVESYQAQINLFPDSKIAAKAQSALDKLAETHPDLFPKKEEDAKSEAPVSEEVVKVELKSSEAAAAAETTPPAVSAPVITPPPVAPPAAETPAPAAETPVPAGETPAPAAETPAPAAETPAPAAETPAPAAETSAPSSQQQ